ncbi:hypothetical protein F931_02249 [Acinetobacter pittii ANC 4050]|uniref:Uncharacterized protein n=1 Tax=Acinetobacter pittii ANC 4050 TaxID=1217691 RepID=R8YIB8_ACIPI|nr:hypothetical protein F931_02249 [Acinetobacter pittii ANC 4050]
MREHSLLQVIVHQEEDFYMGNFLLIKQAQLQLKILYVYEHL